jgi:cephalosporin-C deacetylase-like acetyl esterase
MMKFIELSQEEIGKLVSMDQFDKEIDELWKKRWRAG